jgi:hypothetical protein
MNRGPKRAHHGPAKRLRMRGRMKGETASKQRVRLDAKAGQGNLKLDLVPG